MLKNCSELSVKSAVMTLVRALFERKFMRAELQCYILSRYHDLTFLLLPAAGIHVVFQEPAFYIGIKENEPPAGP